MQTINNTSETQQAERAQLIRELSAMLAQLSVLQSIARPGTGDALSQADMAALREGLAALERMAREMLYEAYETNALEDALSLESLPDLPLAEALARALDETAEALQLSSRVVFSGEEHALSKEIERLLYQIALAALSQVGQHSGARKLRFTLHYENAGLRMSVEDDGVPTARASLQATAWGGLEDEAQSMPVPPFTAQERRGQGSGRDESRPYIGGRDAIHRVLESPDGLLFARLRNRAEMLGGSLEVMASIEHGTQVQARLPYHQQASRAGASPARTLYEAQQALIREELVMDAMDATQDAPANPIRILVVDGLAVTRAGLRRLLESYSDLLVIGEAADGVQAVSEAAELGPQVVIMDAQ